MGAIKISINEHFLREILGFPDDIEFYSASIENHFSDRILNLVIIRNDFPNVEYGNEPIHASPKYKTEKQRIYKLEDWGIPKEE